MRPPKERRFHGSLSDISGCCPSRPGRGSRRRSSNGSGARVASYPLTPIGSTSAGSIGKPLPLDLNVFLDVILDPQSDADVAAGLWAAIERVGDRAWCPLRRDGPPLRPQEGEGAALVRTGVEDLIRVFDVATANDEVVKRAPTFAWPDFEDAVCAAAAEASGCDALVTRDPVGYPDPPLPVIDPAAALSRLTQE